MEKEDIELTLLNFFKTNWSLEGALKKDKVLFHRNMRKVEGTLTEPNIIFRENVDVNAWNNEGMADCLISIVVRTRIQAEGTVNLEVEKTKKLKTNMRKQIYDILREKTLPTDWEWAHVTRRVNADNFDIQKALLGEDLYITVAYQRSG